MPDCVATVGMDEAWAELISAQAELEVISSFPHAVNLRDRISSGLAWIGTRAVKKAPYAWIIDADCIPWHIEAGDRLCARKQGDIVQLVKREPVSVGGADQVLSVHDSDKGFDRCQISQVESARPIAEARSIVADYWQRYGNDRSPFKVARSEDKFITAVSLALKREGDQFARALARRDLTAMRRSASSMIGLGVGLTPSGDDFIVGALALSGAYRGESWFREQAESGVQELSNCTALEELTTYVSSMYISAAVCGRFSHHVAQAATALARRDCPSVSAALDDLLAFGETSGTDVLTGMLYFLNAGE